MATLATQFKAALSRIEPEVDAENAAEAHKLVTAALKADDKLKRLGISTFLIGSYGRQVSIKRVKDVDVFVRLAKATDSLRPGEILDHVTDVLEDAFLGQVTRQHRSVMIDFPDFDLSVDVVIARPCVDHPAEHWQIPEKIEEDGRATWIETNPIKMSELTTEANGDFLLSGTGVYVPLVKLIRQIRRTWVEAQPGGYYFEVLAYQAFQDLQPTENTVAGYLCVILREIADRLPDYVTEGPADPTLDERTITTKATQEQIEAAADRIAVAAQLAEDARDEGDICASALKWQELLGKTQQTDKPEYVFALPEACDADGTEKPMGGLVKGAPAVPAGRGRYA
ncbi:SMODS domain-containing nucleotidyltransferase [Amycolatopsis thermoflava]|uniref:SMODS domain-containing nucleotidyltransferase n=1 Tax=Amycolatopsis thermoflava TaxID=84480 RepID=UPI003660B854